MTRDPQSLPSLFTSMDVSAKSSLGSSPDPEVTSREAVGLLRELVAGQDRQNELLEELVQQLGASQRQRTTELGQWKQANPELARSCRTAAESLSRVQSQFLEDITEDIRDNTDAMMDSDFVLNEFVDRYGPRLAHLNGVLQVLSQLSSVPTPTNN